ADDGSQVGAIVGGVIGGLLLIVLLLILVLVLLRRKYTQPKKPKASASSTLPFNISSDVHGDSEFTPNEPAVHIEQDDADVDHLYGNTGIDNIQRNIPIDNLLPYVAKVKANGNAELERIFKTFSDLPCATQTAGKGVPTKQFNRFRNIIPYDHTRVVLKEIPGVKYSDYINASYIEGYPDVPRVYIAAQGPIEQTAGDYWRMICQENVSNIAMLTNLQENSKPKCYAYWPKNEGEKQTFGNIEVTNIQTDNNYLDYVIYKILVERADEKRTIKLFHFTSWPDHGAPEDAYGLLAFLKKVKMSNHSTGSPLLVHCSAGVGRTGTLIAIDMLLKQAQTEGEVDVNSCVHKLRTQRPFMIQTPEQFIFLHDAILEALVLNDTCIDATDFNKKMLELTKVIPPQGETRIQELYQMLETLKPSLNLTDTKAAREPANAKKNRNPDILPPGKSRPFIISVHQSGKTDYINALYLNGYKNKDGFIVTQRPLPDTLEEFWSLVYDTGSSCIVTLDEENVFNDLDSPAYWDNESNSFGMFEVTVQQENEMSGYVERRLTLRARGKASSEREIVQLHISRWPRFTKDEAKMKSVISMITAMNNFRIGHGKSPVIVQCIDGAERCGVYCATAIGIERLQVEQQIDIFSIVKKIRKNRPQFIKSGEQYTMCHYLIQDYMNQFETYSNFKEIC
ncbi:unnamed protein product, partial [Owenia fusiformis]